MSGGEPNRPRELRAASAIAWKQGAAEVFQDNDGALNLAGDRRIWRTTTTSRIGGEMRLRRQRFPLRMSLSDQDRQERDDSNHTNCEGE
jgi:hypothetical protein